MAEKANPDYSASAENLQENNPILRELMDKRMELLTEMRNIQTQISKTELARKHAQLADAQLEVCKMIQATVPLGGLQDLENGIYALQQRKVTKTYLAEPFVEAFPKMRELVTVTAVDVGKIKGLVKGKLLTEEQLKEAGVIEENVTLAMIIKDRRVE